MFKFLLKLFFKILSVLWPNSFSNKWGHYKVKFHTYRISNEFKSIRQSSSIYYPFVLKGGKCITIGCNVVLGARGVLTAWESYVGQKFIPEITIGDNTSIGEDYHITAINKIIIGNNVLMGKKITITDNSHGKIELEMLELSPKDRPLFSKGFVIIEDNVWLGDKVTVLAGVTIGKNTIIGANSVVTSNIPSNCVAAGVPAKIIKIIKG